MSLNQSKSEKNESQYRKSGGGRFAGPGQQRNFAGGSGQGVCGGSATPSLSTDPFSLSVNRSFKKTSHAQGGQQRVTTGSLKTPEPTAGRSAVQNGARSQLTLHGIHEAQVPIPAATSKPANVPTQGSTKPIPRSPSQLPSVTSDSTGRSTLVRGDGCCGFPLQFGTISPGFINHIQVPARTTSAPPNLDEQKHDEGRHEVLKAAPVIPISSGPKLQVPKKDVSPVVCPTTGESITETKLRKDASLIPAATPAVKQKPAVERMGGISMPLPFHHQPPVSMQFGGPTPQIQSQGMSSTSLPVAMQMPLQMGNASQVQQQVFMHGFQHHLMQPQGLMHQTQGLGFNPPMGPQLPHQLSSLGMSMSPQFSPQLPMKYGSARKTVKITHPETHEELRLDKKTDAYAEGGGPTVSRPTPNVPPQSQPITSYTSPHPVNYYSNSYTAGPPTFPPTSSLPLASAQLTPTSQTSRFNYSVNQAPHTMPFINQSAPNSSFTAASYKGGTPAHATTESSTVDSSQQAQNSVVSTQSTSLQVTIKPAVSSSVEVVVEQGEPPKLSRPSVSSSQPIKDSQMTGDNVLQLSKPSPDHSKPSSSPGAFQSTSMETPSSVSSSSFAESSSTTVNKDMAGVPNSPKENPKESDDQLSHQVKAQASLDSHHSLHTGDSINVEDSECVVIGDEQSTPSDAVGKSLISAASADVGGTVLESGLSVSSKLDGARIDPETVGHCSTLPPDGKNLVSEEHKEKDGSKSFYNGTFGIGSSTSLNVTDESDHNADLNAGSLETDSYCAVQSAPSLAVDRDLHVKTFTSGLHTVSDGGSMLALDASTKDSDSSGADEGATSAIHPAKVTEESLKHEGEGMESTRLTSSSGSRPSSSSGSRPTSSSGSVSSSTKVSLETNRLKISSTRGKKKRKEIFQKADSQGTTSDLYTAYKGPEEKKETVVISDSMGKTLTSDLKLVSTGHTCMNEKDERSKVEPDDWEDAAEISTLKLESSGNAGSWLTTHHIEDSGKAKKYSRDFLLTFSEQCTDLPNGFKIALDIADILIRPNSGSARVVDREYPSPVRIVDRPSGGPRIDRRGSGVTGVSERWGKLPGAFPAGREMGFDPGYGVNLMGFRLGQGNNYGVLRNPRPQFQYPILSGPMQSVQRNNSDADQWRSINFNGLMPPPQTPMQVMHRAEKKYEVAKVTDEEEVKQRRLKGILNKLTPQNFEKLFIQVKENIDNAVTLTGVISQIFDKALMEPTFCEMYADFCSCLASELPVDDQKIAFKRLLLNKCQEEFERGEREEEEANRADNDGGPNQSEEEREVKKLKARRRMLGNIRFIGELYKKRMLTERIMHECIKKLLGHYQNPDEENIEALCKLMSTIGKMIDHPKAKDHMDAYFYVMTELSNNMKLSLRFRFMLKDAIDLRKNKWEQRRKVEGPKKIEEVHRDAVQERQAQASRLSRGHSMSSSMRRGHPLDLGPQGSMLSSPVGHMGSFRGLSSQPRNFGVQDVRMEDRGAFENRISVPFPQRPLGNDSITLGPQGGLARGMSVLGQPSALSIPSADMSIHGDSRRTNGFGSGSELEHHSSRDYHLSRYNPERFSGSSTYDGQSRLDFGAVSVNRNQRNPGSVSDRPIPASLPVKEQGMPAAQNVSSDKVWSEDRLQDRSLAAIREYYSAKDEQEVRLCVKDLNAPTFYPSVISIWVTDSFERKDLERDLLAKLIVELSERQTGIFIASQLIKGFESVLANLEDSVNDAPRAPEYLGRLFAKVIMENIVSFREVGQLLYEGGEESGCLREAGLAGDVLGSVLETVRSERGEAAVKEMRASFNLRLEDFRPPEPLKSRKLELFI